MYTEQIDETIPRETWIEYERRKKEIERIGLTPAEYERAIKVIVDELNL